MNQLWLRYVLLLSVFECPAWCVCASPTPSRLLFDVGESVQDWSRIRARGFYNDVWGVVYQKDDAQYGMSLSGLGTGYVDLDVNGTWGRCTAFGTRVPPRHLGGSPCVGIAIDGEVVVLTTREPTQHNHLGNDPAAFSTPDRGYGFNDVKSAENVAYWGHYPVADIQFDLPVSVEVALKAWSPFFPGNAKESNTPGAVFEVHLRNQEQKPRKISLVFDFPGPSRSELGEKVNYKGWDLSVPEEPKQVVHTVSEVKGDFSGVLFASSVPRNFLWRGDLQVQYALGVAGDHRIRHGGSIGLDSAAWNRIGSQLPFRDEHDHGASVAIDFELAAGEERVVPFILAWFAPRWMAQQYNGEPLNGNRHINRDTYSDRFGGAIEVANYLAKHRESLLKRITRWQCVIYDAPEMPPWLKDCLINSNHIIAQNAIWAHPMARGSSGVNWTGDRGVFAVCESFVSCPQTSCVACDWLGNMPIVYFFPELVESNIRSLAHFQLANGQIPFNLGFGTVVDSPGEYEAASVTNGSEFVDMLHRLWLRTGDDRLLQKYYPNAKLAIQFTKNHTDVDDNGLPDCHGISHIFDCYKWEGNSAFVSSAWLATLKVGQRLAHAASDEEFAKQCESWFQKGKQSLDDELWNSAAKSYFNYRKPATDERSDIVLADQLVGEWVSLYHGVDSVYSAERVATVLDTIRSLNCNQSKYGMVNGVLPDGTRVSENEIYNGIHLGVTTHFTAALMLYNPDEQVRETGMEMARRAWHTVVVKGGRAFNAPVFITLDEDRDEPTLMAEDYYHNSSVWILPPALYGQDLKAFCAPGELIDRIIQAANADK